MIIYSVGNCKESRVNNHKYVVSAQKDPKGLTKKIKTRNNPKENNHDSFVRHTGLINGTATKKKKKNRQLQSGAGIWEQYQSSNR